MSLGGGGVMDHRVATTLPSRSDRQLYGFHDSLQSETLLLEPVEGGLGHLLPAGVDGK